MAVVGVILIVVGLAFLLLGLAAAARQVFQQATAPRTRGLPIDPEKWAKLVSALTELVKVAGVWVLLTLVGGALIGVGAYLIGS